jgi:hypothetical protein
MWPGSPTVTIPAGKNEGEFKLQANEKAANGAYQIAMNASTTGGDGYSGIGRVRVSSAFVKLEIADPFVTISLQRSSVERGHRAEIVATLKQNKPFDGKAALALLRLPKGITMVGPKPEITAADQKVVFHIEAAPDALLGYTATLPAR